MRVFSITIFMIGLAYISPGNWAASYPPAGAAILTFDYSADLSGNHAFVSGHDVIRQCVAVEEELYFLISPLVRRDGTGARVVVTDARGELRRVVDLGARRVVSIAVASGGRLRTIEARGTRSGIVDFDANGYVTADREYPDPLVDFALGPGEDVTVLDGNGRFAVLALSEGGVSLKASFDTGLAVRPPDCALCGQRPRPPSRRTAL